MQIDVADFLYTLPYMAAGMVGIFTVTSVMILTIFLLNKLTQGKNKKQ